ncbi:MAG: PAQR family membrane homeostasis protein TrhA [Candidatus Acidiferrales bacterium]
MNCASPIRSKLRTEELANTITHGIGLVMSIAGFIALVIVAAFRGGALQIISCAVYGSTLVCLYAASTLYHAVRSPRIKRTLKVFDHCAIYLLIAGTYTPFTLVTLRGGWGWSLFAIVWALAMAGIVFKLWFIDHFKILSTILYLAMGWIAVIAIKPLFGSIPVHGLYLLIAGGLLYSVGVAFFAARRLRFGHAIWHVFVLAGSACHYFAVLFYVILAYRI